MKIGNALHHTVINEFSANEKRLQLIFPKHDFELGVWNAGVAILPSNNRSIAIETLL